MKHLKKFNNVYEKEEYVGEKGYDAFADKDISELESIGFQREDGSKYTYHDDRYGVFIDMEIHGGSINVTCRYGFQAQIYLHNSADSVHTTISSLKNMLEVLGYDFV